MLVNVPNFLSPVQQILSDLKSSEFDFYLTGSRFFGNVTLESDWDFFVENNEHITMFLKDLGFVVNTDSTSYDEPGLTVFTKSVQFSELSDTWTKVDIQVVDDLELKLKIMEVLKQHFKNSGLPGTKHQKKQLWNMVRSLVQSK